MEKSFVSQVRHNVIVRSKQLWEKSVEMLSVINGLFAQQEEPSSASFTLARFPSLETVSTASITKSQSYAYVATTLSTMHVDGGHKTG